MTDDLAPWVQHPYGRAKALQQHPQPEQVLVNYDIVASLRESAGWIKDVEHESWFGTADLQNDAADEIERLHTEVNDLRLQVVALSIPKEARRG